MEGGEDEGKIFVRNENEKHLRCEMKSCVYWDCHYEINLAGGEPCGRVEMTGFIFVLVFIN